MPTERLSMRRIREVLRLKHDSGLSERLIARTLQVSDGAVNSYLQRARVAGLSWPLPDSLDDEALERLLFPPAAPKADTRPVPDWTHVERELRRRGVTRALLWEEYRAAHPDGFGYSWFCEHYEAWKACARPTMRQTHVAGEKLFVDFAGDTIEVVDPLTGRVRAVKLFVAALGASNYTYAEARESESLPDWIGAHAHLFAFLGGVPQVVVCDNLKAAVTNPDRYDPGLNRTYAEMARHYGTTVLAARPRKPRDKAKVEVAVQVAQRWILARLRNRRFFCLAELNGAIRELLTARLQRQPRRALRDDRQASPQAIAAAGVRLCPLEALPRRARLPRRGGGPRVLRALPPHPRARRVRIADRTVEIFHKGQRVASHARAPTRRGHTTIADHMPSAHRRHGQWTPARLIAAAERIGPSTVALCEVIMADRPHPEQGFRTCLSTGRGISPVVGFQNSPLWRVW